MNLYKGYEQNFHFRNITGGFVLLPYQFAFGISFRIWCTGPAFRFYFGPFKFWFSTILGTKDA